MTFTRNNFPKGIKQSKDPLSKDKNSKNNKKNKKKKYIPTGNSVGRPTKYKPEFCEKAIKILAKGHSKASLAYQLGASHQTLLEWERKYPEFFKAIQIGLDGSRKWWEDRGHSQCSGGKFNWQVYQLMMTSRFGYNTGANKISLDAQMEHRIEGEVKIDRDPRGFSAEVLDILLQSGAVKAQVDETIDTEDDEVHKTETDS